MLPIAEVEVSVSDMLFAEDEGGSRRSSVPPTKPLEIPCALETLRRCWEGSCGATAAILRREVVAKVRTP